MMRNFRILSLIFSSVAWTPFTDCLADAHEPLKVDEVVQSVKDHHPMLRSVKQEIDIANAALLEAKGAFDPKLKAKNSGYLKGDYSGSYYDLSVEQPLSYQGLSLYAGRRRSGGNFPVYDGDLETNNDGESRFGVKVPLLRNRGIDRPRTDIKKSQVNQDQAEAAVQLEYLDLVRRATHSYWDWVAAGRSLAIYQHLLQVAEKRQKQLEARVRVGDLARIYLTDNQRSLLKRQAQKLKAQQLLQKGELYLSLFLRNNSGSQVVPDRKQLPRQFPIPIDSGLSSEVSLIKMALSRRPEVKILQSQREKTELELKLAENQLLPEVTVDLAAADDHGAGSTSRDEAELKGMLQIEIPLRTRKQRGKIEAQKAKIRALEQKKQFLSQKISTEVNTALAKLKLAYEIIKVQQQEVAAARVLESGERIKFEQGDSNLIFVNIREQTTADAEVGLVEALLDFYKSLADFRAAVAESTLTQ
jgi:outer membrane protein, heavy metal efflux system